MLILYATKHGCTKKCASLLAEKLAGKADICNLKEGRIPDLHQYDKIILGGSVYAGKIAGELQQFCRQNQAVLKEKKLGLFICGLHEKMAETQLRNAYPQELFDAAVVKDCFGGELIYNNLNLAEKIIMKLVAKFDKSLGAIDPTKDISTISESAIDRFAASMNNA